jgi:PAS domain S-box-containing protein
VIARDLIHANVPVLNFDSGVSDAVEYFKKTGTDFAVVMAAKDRLQGILTESSLIKLFLRFQTQKIKEELIYYRDCFDPIQLVQESEDLSALTQKIVVARGHRVVVINRQGEMIGYVSAKDIVGLLSATQKDPSSSLLSDKLNSELYIYESFFTHSPFMMHSISPDGKIQMANEILHRALGYDYGELIGKTLFDLYSKNHHEQAQKGIQKIIANGFHKTIQTEMLKKNGSILKVELASKLLEDPWKRALGTITVSRALDMDEFLSANEAY